MTPSLSSALSNRFKQKLIPATVIDIIGGKCSVRLSGEGRKLTNLSYYGNTPVIGSQVVVDYRNNNVPIVMVGDNPPPKDPTKNLSCDIPESLYLDTGKDYKWDFNLPPIPPVPIPPPPPVPNSSCPDNSSATGPFQVVWDQSALGGNSGVTVANAWRKCIVRGMTATNLTSLYVTISFIGQTKPNLKVYAIDSAKNRLITATVTWESDGTVYNATMFGDTYALNAKIRADFYPSIATLVAGFQIEVVGGYVFTGLPFTVKDRWGVEVGTDGSNVEDNWGGGGGYTEIPNITIQTYDKANGKLTINVQNYAYNALDTGEWQGIRLKLYTTNYTGKLFVYVSGDGHSVINDKRPWNQPIDTTDLMQFLHTVGFPGGGGSGHYDLTLATGTNLSLPAFTAFANLFAWVDPGTGQPWDWSLHQFGLPLDIFARMTAFNLRDTWANFNITYMYCSTTPTMGSGQVTLGASSLVNVCEAQS